MRYRAKSVGLGDMNTSPTQFAIPGDLASCQVLIQQLAMTIEEVLQKNAKLEQEKQEIELAFAELLQRAFRNRSERYLNDPDQLRLDLNNTDNWQRSPSSFTTAESGGLTCRLFRFPKNTLTWCSNPLSRRPFDRPSICNT